MLGIKSAPLEHEARGISQNTCYISLGKRLQSNQLNETQTPRLTVGLHALAELRLHLAVGPLGGQLGQLAGHGGGGDNGLEAALALGHVLLRVEDDDVDLGHVEHAQRHGGAHMSCATSSCR